MTWWDHFLADLVPTAMMVGLFLAALAAYGLVCYLAGVRHGSRDAWEAVERRQAGYDQQINETVPMLTAGGGR